MIIRMEWPLAIDKWMDRPLANNPPFLFCFLHFYKKYIFHFQIFSTFSFPNFQFPGKIYFILQIFSSFSFPIFFSSEKLYFSSAKITFLTWGKCFNITNWRKAYSGEQLFFSEENVPHELRLSEFAQNCKSPPFFYCLNFEKADCSILALSVSRLVGRLASPLIFFFNY